MSSSGKSRVVWTCPECSRSFRIPKSKAWPRLCAKCSRKEKAAGAATSSGEDDANEMIFQEAESTGSSSLKFGVVAQSATTHPAPQSKSTPNSISHADGGSTTSIDELSDRIDEMLEHLEGITQTMKLVRWVMWGLGVATVINVVVTAGALLHSMSMMGSLTDLLGQPAGGFAIDELPAEGGRAGDGRGRNAQIPPQLREKLKPIEDYSNTVNDLLKEVNQ